MPDLPDRPADAELLAAHVAGDRNAFAELVHRHRDRLWAVALRTTGDPEDAADAVQDALVAAYRRAGDFRGEAAVTTWLHRIVVNACLDRIRRRRTVLPLDIAEGTADDPGGDRDSALDVAAALRRLPVEQRAALVLVDVTGLPVQEAAAVLRIPVGTVKSRCARGRARLAVALAHLRPVPGNQGGGPGVPSGSPLGPGEDGDDG